MESHPSREASPKPSRSQHDPQREGTSPLPAARALTGDTLGWGLAV